MKPLKSLALSLVLFLTVPVDAASTIYGPTGLVTVPTAESLRYKEFYVGFDYLIADKEENDEWYYKANLGTFENVEIGVVGGSQPSEGMYLNLKYYLMSNTSRLPLSIAVGMENISSQDNTGFYMVASKKLRVDWGAHLGFKAIIESETVTPTIMGGTNYILNDQLELMVDASGDSSVYTLNGGINFYILPSLMLRAAVIDIGQSTIIGTRAVAGISYSKFL